MFSKEENNFGIIDIPYVFLLFFGESIIDYLIGSCCCKERTYRGRERERKNEPSKRRRRRRRKYSISKEMEREGGKN